MTAQLSPAIGGGGRLSRTALTWRALLAVVLLVLLVAAKHVVSAREVGPDPLSGLQGGQPVAPGLDIGGEPADSDLQALAGSYRVDGVVNLLGPSVAEQVTAASLKIGYLHLELSSGAAPTLAQLRTLASFMRAHTRNGESGYVHDDDGGNRAVVTACMLLLIRGDSWATVRRSVTPAALRILSPRQTRAVSELRAALLSPGKSLSGNPYSKARVDPW